MLRWLKKFLSGTSRLSSCWLGLHRWSMPGGHCERCGVCDRFFGGHEDCGDTCEYYRPDVIEWIRQREAERRRKSGDAPDS